MRAVSQMLIVSLLVAGACTPSSPTIVKIENALDQVKAGIDANPQDCKKMAESIQGPVKDVVSGLKEVQEKKEKLPASTKLKFARIVASFQGLGDCGKSPEMMSLVQSVAGSATGH